MVSVAHKTRSTRRRAIARVRDLHLRPERPAATAEAPVPEAVAPDPSRVACDRARASGGPLDRAHYGCACGYRFEADVSTSVSCPHCGAGQAW